jgi:two-component system, NarL family, sensor histidine kinase DesK
VVAHATRGRRGRTRASAALGCGHRADFGRELSTARDALHRVRETVAGYHQPTLAQELSAAAELLDAAGIRVELDSGVQEVPAPIDSLLAWTFREGVTNVIRHSRARACRIALRPHAGALRLEIRDDGEGHAEREPGTGLIGLTERAAIVGGNLRAGPVAGGGFSLCLDVPHPEMTT